MPLTSTVEIRSSRPQFGGAMIYSGAAPVDAMMLDAVSTNAAAGAWPDLNFAMPPKKAPFPRTARLLRHADFERVYKQGRRHFSASMTVFYWAPPPTEKAGQEIEQKNGAGSPHGTAHGPAAHDPMPQRLRVGFTVGRALGGAVVRNRMKRRLREAVRLAGPGFELGAGMAGVDVVRVDVVINPKKSLLKADFADVVNEVKRAFAVIEQKLSGKTAGAIDTKAGSRRPEAESRS